MKPDEMRLVVAEAMGWKADNVIGVFVKDSLFARPNTLPNYLTDQNTRPEMLAALSEGGVQSLLYPLSAIYLTILVGCHGYF